MNPDLPLALFRLCAGLAFVPYAVTKLFAGLEVRTRIAQQFAHVGIAHALGMVIVAGMIELALSVVLTIGFGTRPAALLAALYLVITMLIGGGWQYRVLWIVACAGLAIAGGGRWSLDAWLKDI
jgi:putative oxidoreductase